MKTGVFVFIPTNLRGGNTILRAICYTVYHNCTDGS